jgi:alanyl-tRNA synthetase
MNQFKDVFLGNGKRPYSRAADTQKCIRVSGKHNDLEEVGRDTYHHTLFEMLGNWSFGDYYKKEAIEWAWQILTDEWKIPKNRLWATIYKDDDEAEHYWKTVTDIDHRRIIRFSEKYNFWEMGETGPCGPCSEVHYDRTPKATADASMINGADAQVIELWNLVFIRYNRGADKKLTPLPAKHVDTGMGFERLCAVLQQKQSNYDTDIFAPLLDGISKNCGIPYSGLMESDTDIAFRVIADHIRALTFAIGDGAIPSNEGRGYVLRRILRRAARFGRKLNLHEPFLYKLVPILVETMSSVFPEIKGKQEFIQKVIRGEEEGFNATLDRGLELFEEVVALTKRHNANKVRGEEVFKLYDTFGFPVDLTALLSRERGLDIDQDGFDSLMEQQRVRSREFQGGSSGTDQSDIETQIAKETARAIDTDPFEQLFQFVGYDLLKTETEVLEARDRFLILTKSPFYAESGGQLGDTGSITVGDWTYNVVDTQRSGTVNVHILDPPVHLKSGSVGVAKVDEVRRRSIMQNHTATHLLHAALRSVLGEHVRQAGSLVAPEYLRFDFSHFAKVSDSEIEAIESLVNEKIFSNISLVHHRNIPFDDAKKMGALMFFGEKYGSSVNVIQVNDYSKEFCGGTHVQTTGDIGYFKIRSEGSIAAGTRRIEAVTGASAGTLFEVREQFLAERVEFAVSQYDAISLAHDELLAISPALNLTFNRPVSSYCARLQPLRRRVEGIPEFKELNRYFSEQAQRLNQTEEILLSLTELQKNVEKERSRLRLQSVSSSFDTIIKNAVTVNGINVVTAQIQASTMDELKSLGDTLRAKLGSGVGVLCSIVGDKAAIVCVVTDNLIKLKKLQAGAIVGKVAKLLGGGGGGKAHLATAGGKDIEKIGEAMAAVAEIVKSMTS